MSGNETNRKFYSKVPLGVFQDLTKQGGFADCKDLKLIASQIPSEAKVIELGAGYGRCVDFLLTQKHTGPIVAIEQSLPMVVVLKEKYKEISSVTVLSKDFSAMNETFQADIILWIFSGLLDFSKQEQLTVLKKIREWLVDGGKLFVDIPQLSELTIARFTTQQDILMETPYGSIETFLPSIEDMKAYAKAAGYTSITPLDYDSDTGKKRTMFILTA